MVSPKQRKLSVSHLENILWAEAEDQLLPAEPEAVICWFLLFFEGEEAPYKSQKRG